MVLTTPKTFGSPNVKGGSEKGTAQQESTALVLHLLPPSWGGSDPPAREICHGLRISGSGDREMTAAESQGQMVASPRSQDQGGGPRAGHWDGSPAPACPSPG